MAAYRKKAANDRDALFGGMNKDSGSSNVGGGSSSRAGVGGASRPKAPPSSRPTPPAAAGAGGGDDAMERLRKMKQGGGPQQRPGLQGELRVQKLKEAQEYKDKANKCMQKSFFSKPDPVAASTFYKRAADCYQQVGFDMAREERLYRIQSAQCNAMIQAWASVASDYTRAAVLLSQQYEANQPPDPTIADPAREAWAYYLKASEAYLQMNEKSKAAGAQIKAAMALNSFRNNNNNSGNLTKQSLTAMEEAVEAHVPDPLNPYARYRQTGQSAFDEEGGGRPSPATMQLAREHMVTASYAHEPVQELIYLLVHPYREYPTALYAAGAATALLERDGHATISISRMYLTETILLLAMGDAVAAQEQFMQRHVQKTFYLTARECQLAEELFRAVLDRNPDSLDDVRSPTGRNKAALANLHPSIRQLVTEIRLSGVARKNTTTTKKNPAQQQQQPPRAAAGRGRGKPSSSSSSSSSSSQQPSKTTTKTTKSSAAAGLEESSLNDLVNMKTGYETEIQQGGNLKTEALTAELDQFDLGGESGDEEEDLDDDDFDLR